MRFQPPRGALGELVAGARADCAARRRARPGLPSELERLRGERRGFARALAAPSRRGFPLICEVKRASPSAGAIRAGAAAVAQARAYVEGGAACVSVLTEARRFGGSLEDLAAVRAAIDAPLLRKDFMVDPYMVYEAAEAGADCVLLIAGAVEPTLLEELFRCASSLDLDVLLEVVHEPELELLERIPTPLVGVNARDLETLEVDPGRIEGLGPTVVRAGRLLVAESGIQGPEDVARAARAGARAALVGEALMRSADPAEVVRRLAGAA